MDLNKNGKKDIYEDSAVEIGKRVEDLLSQMTVDEKTCQLATISWNGHIPKSFVPTPGWKQELWKDGIAIIDAGASEAGNNGVVEGEAILEGPEKTAQWLNAIQRWFIEDTRLGIPVDFTIDGVRGLHDAQATNFPSNLAMGATWNPGLFSQVGHVIGREARAMGYTNVCAPVLDLCRDPRWGRTVECYGEDPFLVARMGIAMASALQEESVTSTGKHFAVYSEPQGGRDGSGLADPHIAPREMEMLHLWPWEQLVKESGLRGVVSSDGDYDGIPISGAREFLIDRLRDQWGFRGYVVSDSQAVEFLHNRQHVAGSPGEAAAMFLREGGNVLKSASQPTEYLLAIRKQIGEGKLDMATLDDRVRDVLRVKFAVGEFDHPYVVDPLQANKMLHTPEAVDLSLMAARQSLVLLKNANNILPLSKSIKRLLVTGPCAARSESGCDRYGWSGRQGLSLLEGIQAAVPGMKVVFSQGAEITDAGWPESELTHEPPARKDAEMMAQAVKAARDADAIVVAVGDSHRTVGEGKSRTSLDLPGLQEDLVRELVATGKPVVVVMMSGRPATINWTNRHAPAILEAWFPGEAGGRAIAEAIFGDYNPGGKLPVTFPRTVGQVPMNFPCKSSRSGGSVPAGNPNGNGNARVEGVLYPFGYGLSYTTFSYGNLKISPQVQSVDGEVTVTFTLKNTGRWEGDEVPQLYVRQTGSSVSTYDLNLRGFERTHLQPGEKRDVTFQLPVSSMWLINRNGERIVEPGEFQVFIGSSSEDIRLEGKFVVGG